MRMALHYPITKVTVFKTVEKEQLPTRPPATMVPYRELKEAKKMLRVNSVETEVKSYKLVSCPFQDSTVPTCQKGTTKV